MPVGIRILFSFYVTFTYCALVFLSSPFANSEKISVDLPHPILFHLGNFVYLFALPLFFISFFFNHLFSLEKWGKEIAYIFAYSLIPFSVVAWIGGSLDSFHFFLFLFLVFCYGWTVGYFRPLEIPDWINNLPSGVKLEMLREKSNELRNGLHLVLGLLGGGGFVSLIESSAASGRFVGIVAALFIGAFLFMLMGIRYRAASFKEKIIELSIEKEKKENHLSSQINELYGYFMQERTAKKESGGNPNKGP